MTKIVHIDGERLRSFPRPSGDSVLTFTFHCTVGVSGRAFMRNSLAKAAKPTHQLGVTYSIWLDNEKVDGTLIHRHQPYNHYSNHVPGSFYDPARDKFVLFNRNGNGVECINPADPRPGKGPGKPRIGQKIIRAPWYPGGRYICLSEEQMRACWALLNHELNTYDSLPHQYPGYRDGRFCWSGLPKDWRVPGVYAHRQASPNHGDGLPQTLYCLLRWLGYGHEDAYRLVEEISASATRDGRLWLSPVPLPGGGLSPSPPQNPITAETGSGGGSSSSAPAPPQSSGDSGSDDDTDDDDTDNNPVLAAGALALLGGWRMWKAWKDIKGVTGDLNDLLSGAGGQ